eukprot:880890-Rhodomonas_salina.1
MGLPELISDVPEPRDMRCETSKLPMSLGALGPTNWSAHLRLGLVPLKTPHASSQRTALPQICARTFPISQSSTRHSPEPSAHLPMPWNQVLKALPLVFLVGLATPTPPFLPSVR